MSIDILCTLLPTRFAAYTEGENVLRAIRAVIRGGDAKDHALMRPIQRYPFAR